MSEDLVTHPSFGALLASLAQALESRGVSRQDAFMVLSEALVRLRRKERSSARKSSSKSPKRSPAKRAKKAKKTKKTKKTKKAGSGRR